MSTTTARQARARKAGGVQLQAWREQRGAKRQAQEPGAVVVEVTHAVLPGRRNEFLALMAEARPIIASLLRRAGGGDHTLLEDRARPGLFREVLRFTTEEQREAFDDLHSEDRRIAALAVMIDDLLDVRRADYRVLTLRS